MYSNIKRMKIKYWVLRNVFFYNPEIRSLFGQCHFCKGEYFKKEDAIKVETWNMPATNFAIYQKDYNLKSEAEKARLDTREPNERTYFNFETHKCKNCGQNWRYNRISSKEIVYEHFE